MKQNGRKKGHIHAHIIKFENKLIAMKIKFRTI